LPRVNIYGGYLAKQIDLARNFPPIYLRILPPVVGLTYFCDLDILFSFWFLRAVAIVKLGLMTRVGFTIGLKDQQVDGSGILALESHGALILLALWTFYVARSHLARVWIAIRKGSDHPFNDGVIPYRAAASGLVISTVFIVGWMSAVGMSIGIAILQTTLIYVSYLTVAKFTAASGLRTCCPYSQRAAAYSNSSWEQATCSRATLLAWRSSTPARSSVTIASRPGQPCPITSVCSEIDHGP